MNLPARPIHLLMNEPGSSDRDQRLLLWLIFAGYIASYVFLYIWTVFFNGTGEMGSPIDIHPAWFKIGSDLLGNIHR